MRLRRLCASLSLMKLKSKVDGGEATVVTEVEMTGNVSASVRVAVSSLTGLVDDVTLGYLERRAAGGKTVQRLEALWNADINGFKVRALEDGIPTGATLDLPDATEAVLRILDQGVDLVLHAGEPTGESLADLAPEADLATLVQAPSTESAVHAFGAEGLGQKATLWFGQFTLHFGLDIGIGDVETAIASDLIGAQQYLEEAQELLDSGASGDAAVLAMYNLLSFASLEANGAWDLLLTALDDDTLQPSTQGVDAEKNLKTGLGWVFPASQDMYDAMQSGGTSIAQVKSHVKVGLKKWELAIAQIAGFKSISHGTREKALDFSIE